MNYTIVEKQQFELTLTPTHYLARETVTWIYFLSGSIIHFFVKIQILVQFHFRPIQLVSDIEAILF